MSTELPPVNSAVPITDSTQAMTQTALLRVRTTVQFRDQAQVITLTELPRVRTTELVDGPRGSLCDLRQSSRAF